MKGVLYMEWFNDYKQMALDELEVEHKALCQQINYLTNAMQLTYDDYSYCTMLSELNDLEVRLEVVEEQLGLL
jgi:hypothetical protein